jgi:hypothetical protein
MNRVKVAVAVALGMVAAAVSFFPIGELFISGCASDPNCSVIARILGAVLASFSIGLLVAWAVDRSLAAIVNRRQQN